MEGSKSFCPNPQCVSREVDAGVRYCTRCGASVLLDGKYRLVRMLGQGGMGRTFLALDQRFRGTPNEQCVVKELKADVLDEEKGHKLLRREASRLLELRHENIPSFRDFVEVTFAPDEHGRYLVQQFIDGEDLDHLLEREGALPLSRLVPWMTDTLLILRYLHEQIDHETGKAKPMLHLDVKPQNLMIRKSDQRLFLIDFGVATQLQMTQLQTHGARASVQGYTPGFAPFEQTMGYVAPGSDVFSWAMTFLTLATGKSSAALMNPLGGTLSYRGFTVLSDAFAGLLDDCLRLDLRDRVPHAKEAWERLSQTQEFQSYGKHGAKTSFGGEPLGANPLAAVAVPETPQNPLPTGESEHWSDAYGETASARDIASPERALPPSFTELPQDGLLDEGTKGVAPGQSPSLLWALVALSVMVLLLGGLLFFYMTRRPTAIGIASPTQRVTLEVKTLRTPVTSRQSVRVPAKVATTAARVAVTPAPWRILSRIVPKARQVPGLSRRGVRRTRVKRRWSGAKPYYLTSPFRRAGATTETCVAMAPAIPAAMRMKLEDLIQSGSAASYQAYLSLLQARHKAVPTLPVMLCLLHLRGEARQRRRVMTLLGSIGTYRPTPAIIGTLTDGLGDRDPSIRATSLLSLARYGKGAVRFLNQVLDEKLTSRLPRPHLSQQFLFMVLGTLIRLGPAMDSSTIALLGRLLDTSLRTPEKRRVIQALGASRRADAVPFLQRFLQAGTGLSASLLHFHAIDSLGQIGPPAATALDVLRDLAKKSAHYKKRVSFALLQIQPARLRALTKQLLTGNGTEQRKVLAVFSEVPQSLGHVLAPLKQYIRSQASATLRVNALHLVFSMLRAPTLSPKVPHKALLQILTHTLCQEDQQSMRLKAAKLLMYLRAKARGEIPALWRCWKRLDHDGQRNVIEIVVRQWPTYPPFVAALPALSKHPHEGVRSWVRQRKRYMP